MKGSVVGLVLLGGVLWWLSRPKPIPAPAPLAQGGIPSLSIDGVPMGAHLVSKRPGDIATITVTWFGQTRNFQGALIPWRYRIEVFGNSETTGAEVAFGVSSSDEGGPLVRRTSTILVSLPSTLVAGERIAVIAELHAEVSNPDGTPLSGQFDVVSIAQLAHPNAIVVVAPAPTVGPAAPGGGINTVDVAQAILGQMYG